MKIDGGRELIEQIFLIFLGVGVGGKKTWRVLEIRSVLGVVTMNAF